MLLSMTGFGSAMTRGDSTAVSVEIKAVNNRYLKISLRTTDGYATFESRIENLLRGVLRRGTITVNVRIVREGNTADYAINEQVLASYVRQLRDMNAQLGIETPIEPTHLLALPGVTKESVGFEDDIDAIWPIIEAAVTFAVNELQTMRQKEGASMVADLQENCRQLTDWITQVETLVPNVAGQYRAKLNERIGRVMAEYELTLEPNDLVREVALFVDRSDISEEIVRFRSHLAQFNEVIALPDSNDGKGRRLDFLTQEMFREVNTIGSKANDSEITRCVVELKAIIERIREMVQNVE